MLQRLLNYGKVNIVRLNLNNIDHLWKEIQCGSGKSGLILSDKGI